MYKYTAHFVETPFQPLHPADTRPQETMEVVVVENIYLLVIITLLSVLQNGEEWTQTVNGQCFHSLKMGK